jgi:integrase
LALFERIGKRRNLGSGVLFQVCYNSLQCPWLRGLRKLDWQQPRPRIHDLRHTWKTNARSSVIDSEIREMILGHSDRSLDVSERYGFVDDNELVTSSDKFTYDNGLTQILVASKAEK